MKMKKMLCSKEFLLSGIILFFIFSPGSVFAAQADAGLPGEYLSFGAGARSMGMGKAYTALSDDASATYWNSAGLTQLDKMEMTSLYSPLLMDTGYSFLSVAYPFKKSIMGVSLVTLSSDNFDRRGSNREQLGKFSNAEEAVMVSYSRKVYSHFSAGVNFKGVFQKLCGYSDSGYGLDLNLFYNRFSFLNMGLSLKNVVSPQIKLVRDTDKFPLDIRLGLASRLLRDKLILTVDINRTEKRAAQFHTGLEYSPWNVISVRAGMDDTEKTLGLGLNFSTTLGIISLDYAYAFHDTVKGAADLGVFHRFGINLKFGRTFAQDMVKEERKQLEVLDGEIEKAKTDLSSVRKELEETAALIREMNGKQEAKKALLEKKEEELMRIEKFLGGEKSRMEKEKGILEKRLDEITPPGKEKIPEYYEVREGETLEDIAWKLYRDRTRWIEIYQMNKEKLPKGVPAPGQVLVIPK